jgi:hypothetical protein
MEIAIVGGGAAGFFAAITVKENFPAARVVIFEKAGTVLAKVKVSGGGRCNVTNAAATLKELLAAYPRGAKVLKKGFRVFDNHDAMAWFTRRGVPLVIQEDNCVFPRAQDSQAIIDCLLGQAELLKIGLETGRGVKAILPEGDRLRLDFGEGDRRLFDKVIVTTGGSPRRQGLAWLERLGHRIVEPVPSLFTFNMPADPITELRGIVVDNVLVGIPGTKLKADGPLLITHWGMSGPAILKLSSFGARLLSDRAYDFTMLVNWAHEANNEAVLLRLAAIGEGQANKFLANVRPYGLPERLWRFLLAKSGLAADKKWGELGKKGLHKLLGVLTADTYAVAGKASFKDEFVTCGGISLDSVDPATMQSRVCPHLYFAGEVLDIDGITGGYNFQAAWTTAFIAGRLR